jgi:hypothetical protein
VKTNGGTKFNSQCSPEEYARRKARWTLRDAVRCGKMKRGSSCEFEGGECDGPIQAHHDDYSKPFDVRWICRLHHARVDAHKHEKEFTVLPARLGPILRREKQLERLRAYWLEKARRYDEANTGKGNRRAIDMRRPNPRFDPVERTA